VAAGETTAVIGPLLWLLGKLIVLLSTVISWLLLPLTWLRDQIQAFRPSGLGRFRAHRRDRLAGCCSGWAAARTGWRR
jgi:hypothetical protein